MAIDYLGNTLPTSEPTVRVYIGSGVLVHAFAIYVALEDDDVEAYWISIDPSG